MRSLGIQGVQQFEELWVLWLKQYWAILMVLQWEGQLGLWWVPSWVLNLVGY